MASAEPWNPAHHIDQRELDGEHLTHIAEEEPLDEDGDGAEHEDEATTSERHPIRREAAAERDVLYTEASAERPSRPSSESTEATPVIIAPPPMRDGGINDIFMYVFSGLLLIFLIEQAIQLGAAIGASRSYNLM